MYLTVIETDVLERSVSEAFEIGRSSQLGFDGVLETGRLEPLRLRQSAPMDRSSLFRPRLGAKAPSEQIQSDISQTEAPKLKFLMKVYN
jgi:hypothetical protein